MGNGKQKQKQERFNEVIGVLFLLTGLFAFVSLLFFNPSDSSFYTSHPNQHPRNVTGIVGVYLSHYLIFVFGLSAYAIPALFLFWSSCFFLQKVPQKKWIEFLGLLVSMIAVASIAALSVAAAWKVKAGGFIGYFVAANLEKYFGIIGGLIISVCCLILALILATDFLLYPLMSRAWASFLKTWDRFKTFLPDLSVFEKKSGSRMKVAPASQSKSAAAFDMKKMEAPEIRLNVPKIKDDEEEKAFNEALKITRFKKEKLPKPKAAEAKEVEKAPKIAGNFQLPSIDLLKQPDPNQVVIKDDLHANSRILEETLRDFGIEAKVTAVEQGPVITRYELMPAPGVKVNRIVSLGDDLALALRATSVRFIAPIPGKAAIGIEIPNSTTVMVYLRELLESSEYRDQSFKLPLTLGKNTSGKSLISELSDMPHLLIAGTTGSGKTVCVNSIIAGLLCSKTPEQLKFVMIDPKMVELAIYKDIPHMLAPVVTDTRKAAATLNWVVNEMDKRYRYFAACGTRNIHSFNDRTVKPGEKTEEDQPIPEKLPYIVVVIDELADLMMVAQEKVEGAITRLAQLSRAVGIHLILATQRPSVDVITGVIKANFPSRISFKVASKVDSRTVLDVNGAEKLLGKGDMLFMEPGEPKPIRGQAALITDEEITKIVDFIKKQQGPQYLEELETIQSGNITARNLEKDELYDEAVRTILETRVASVSTLQRRLRLGYGRAARIIDMMEQEGIVGPFQGSKPREIYIDRLEQIERPSKEEQPQSE